MITYTYPWPELPNAKVPKLHKIKYNPDYNWGEVYRWCQDCCCAPFYFGPTWSGTFVEFEDDQDATLFALKFA